MTRGLKTHCILIALLLSGCSGTPSRVHVPSMDPEAAGASAISQHDRNHDGFIDAEELKSCPGLNSCAKWVDTNSDGKISAEEISARVQSYLDRKTGIMTFSCTVYRGGKPLSGAEVTMEPESFLGPAVEPASGICAPTGSATMAIQGQVHSGVRPGMYRVKVSKKDSAGVETIPARYNRETVLGLEANADMLSIDEHVATRTFRL